MSVDRRDFLRIGGLSLVAGLAGCRREAAGDQSAPDAPADHTITIATGRVELAPDHVITTTLYNGQFPGPLLRLREGRAVTIDLVNETDTAEQLHWHGQFVPVDVDGAAEEGTPDIPAHGRRRITFTPGPSGLRFYHTHNRAAGDLGAGLYGGQVGIVYIEPNEHAGDYDQEVFLLLKEFGPSLSRGGDMPQDFLAPATKVRDLESAGESAMNASLASGRPHGYEVGYDAFTVNGRMLGHGDPIRVKANTRVMLHVVNGSATETRSLALPGHTFRVVALDGNPVPAPKDVPVLWIGTGERVSAVVTMNRPGVWILGDVSDDRDHGMGIVVEYAGATGQPRWQSPPSFKWNYTIFGGPAAASAPPDATIDLRFTKDNAADNGFNRWLVNDHAFDMKSRTPEFSFALGRTHRLLLRNASDDIHPIHLHRHRFELASIAGVPTRGVLKDVVMLGGYQEMAIDVRATAPGLSLFHCHQQLHMDFGFMALVNSR